jgi:hypothetical protein
LSLSFPAGSVRQLHDLYSAGNDAYVHICCHIEIVSTRAGFDALETQWNALFQRAARADQVFQNFNWLWHWANHFLNEKTQLTCCGKASRFVVIRRRGFAYSIAVR